MAKMRKGTKVIMWLIILAVLGAIFSALGLGPIGATLGAKLFFFDLGITSFVAFVGLSVVETAKVLTGALSKSKALTKNADSIAEMAKVAVPDKENNKQISQQDSKENSKYKPICKKKDKTLKAGINYIKSLKKLDQFNVVPVTYGRQRAGVDSKQLKYSQKRDVYGLMNKHYTNSGKTQKASKANKKKLKIERKMENMEDTDVSAFAPSYHYAAEYYNPATRTWEKDERSSVNFNNLNIAEVAREKFANTVEERYNKENKRRGATVITVSSRGDDSIKEVSASVNAASLVNTMEFLALADYVTTAKATQNYGFPIAIETQEYKLDGKKNGKQTITIIKDMDDLVQKINSLKQTTEWKSEDKTDSRAIIKC